MSICKTRKIAENIVANKNCCALTIDYYFLNFKQPGPRLHFGNLEQAFNFTLYSFIK